MRILLFVLLWILVDSHKFCFLYSEDVAVSQNYTNDIVIDDYSTVEECDPFNIDNETIPIVYMDFNRVFDEYEKFSNFSAPIRYLLLYSYLLRKNATFYDVCVRLNAEGINITDPVITLSESLNSIIYGIDMLCRFYTSSPLMRKVFSMTGLNYILKSTNATREQNVMVESTVSTNVTQYDIGNLTAMVFTGLYKVFNPAANLKDTVYDNAARAWKYTKFSYEPAAKVNKQLFQGVKNFVKNTKVFTFRAKYKWSGRLPGQNHTLVWWNVTDDLGYLNNRILYVLRLNINRTGCDWGIPYWEVNDTCSATLLAEPSTEWIDEIEKSVCSPATNPIADLTTMYQFFYNLIIYGIFDVGTFTCILVNAYVVQWAVIALVGGIILGLYAMFILLLTIVAFQIFVR